MENFTLKTQSKDKLEFIESVRSSLNYWMKHKDWEFVKFIIVEGKNSYLGILDDSSEDECSIVPLFIRNCPWKMEDTDTDNYEHKPWVVYLCGTDNSNYGKRFNSKKDALKCANNQEIIDIHKEEMFWIN